MARAVAEPVSIVIPGPPVAVAPAAPAVTWAAAAATMRSWRLQKALSSSDTVNATQDPKYVAQLAASIPEIAGDENAFLGELGLVSEAQSALSPAALSGYLRCYGALWLTDTPPATGGGPSFLQRAYFISAVSGDTSSVARLTVSVSDIAGGTTMMEPYSTLLATIATDTQADYGAATSAVTIIHYPCGALEAVNTIINDAKLASAKSHP